MGKNNQKKGEKNKWLKLKTDSVGKCIRSLALNAVRKLKFPLNRTEQDLFTAENAIKSTESPLGAMAAEEIETTNSKQISFSNFAKLFSNSFLFLF